MSTLIRQIALHQIFPLPSGLGLDSAAAMELAPLIRPETTKVAATTVPPPMPSTTQLLGNSGRGPGSQPLGQEGFKGPAAAAASPFSFSSVPTPPPTYASAAAASPLTASSARAKAADPGTAGSSGGGDSNSFPQVHCTFNFQLKGGR